MTESSQSQSFETPAPASRIEGVPEALQLTALDNIVGLKSLLEERFDAQNPSGTPDERDEYVQNGIVNSLAGNGLVSKADDDSEAREKYAIALQVYQAVAVYDDLSWIDDQHTKNNMSPREEISKLLRDQGGVWEAKAEEKTINEGLDQVRKRYAELLVARTQKVFEFGEGRITGEQGVDKVDQLKNIDQAREEFGEYLNALATEMAEKFRSRGLQPTEYSDEIETFITEQTDKFISTFEEMRADVQKTPPGVIHSALSKWKWGADKFEQGKQWTLDKWASWSADQDVSQTFWQRITSKENLKNNLKKGALFAVPSAIVGASVGFVASPLLAAAGVVGLGAALAGAGGALLAKGIGRNVATHKLDALAHSKTIAERQANDFRFRGDNIQGRYDEMMQYDGIDLDTLEDAFASKEEFEEFKTRVEESRKDFKEVSAHEAILALIDERTDFYRKQNRNRFLAGTAISIVSGALGAYVGGLISSSIAGAYHGGIGQQATSGGSSSAQHPSATSSPSPTTPSAAPTALPSGSSPAPSVTPSPSPTITHAPGSSVSPSPSDIPSPTKIPGSETHNPGDGHDDELPTFKILEKDDAQVRSGVGGYEKLADIGVDAKDRAKLWKIVGPKLYNMHDSDDMRLTYKENGEWRINMTENGKWSEEAIKLIVNEAHEHNISTDYDKFFDASINEHTSANDLHSAIAEYANGRNELHIAKGESGHEFMRELGADAKDRAELWNTVAPKLDDNLTYRMPDGEWRLNMTPDHHMPISAIETAVETAQSKGIETDYTSVLEASSSRLHTDNSFTANQFSTHLNRDMRPYYDALKGVDPRHKADVLSLAAHDLQSYKLTEKVNGVWRFREVNSLPPKAAELLGRIADRHNWTLAA